MENQSLLLTLTPRFIPVLITNIGVKTPVNISMLEAQQYLEILTYR
jgi:hypothetical protein